MPQSNWRAIIKQIESCRSQETIEDKIACLKELFSETHDGMVAFALGEEYEKNGDIEAATNYYVKARELFPLPKYKQNAVQALTRLNASIATRSSEDVVFLKRKNETRARQTEPNLLSYDPLTTLFIVPCTKRKIWNISPDASEYVPARVAYVGDSFKAFISWAEERQLEKGGIYWVILSGRYGFLEPWHPISDYDIAIDDESAFPITESALINQTKQIRWRRSPAGKRKFRLAQFTNVICVNCSEPYMKKVRISFPGASISNIRI